MCGACGVGRGDWLTEFLSTSYARSVVAARFADLLPGLAVSASAAGWSVRWRGGSARFHADLDTLLREVASAIDTDAVPVRARVTELPPHRPVLIPRDSVPERYRAPDTPVTSTACAAATEGAADAPWRAESSAAALDEIDVCSVLNQLLGAALARARGDGDVTVGLQDLDGPWLFTLAEHSGG